MRIGLLPLDERPVNARLPGQIAALAGGALELPPAGVLSRKKRPADTEALVSWAAALAHGDPVPAALVVSLDMLGHGGLIAARTTADALSEVVSRWEVLRELRAVAPETRVHAVSLVTRAPNSYNDDEEPAYWSEIGADLHAFGGALHRSFLGEPAADGATPASFRERLPAEPVADFTARRLRNHTGNLAALGLAADGVLDTLLLTADDTAERSAGSLEQIWLRHWTDVLAPPPGRVLSHPGADEVGSVLTARAVLAELDVPPPSVAVVCGVPGGLERVAPYENQPLGVGAEGHVRACGARLTDPGDADLVLVVHPWDTAGGDWAHRHPTVRDSSHPEVLATVAEVATHRARGAAVAVADCGYPNGSDPALVSALGERGPWEDLAGYAGWNTAGNTMGSVIAQAVVHTAARRAGVLDTAAHRALLLHRLVEDHAYMAGIRGAALAEFTDRTRHSTLPAELVEPVRAWVAERLATAPGELPGFAGWTVPPDSVTLPWQRTFEVDFAVTAPATSGSGERS
ncbi:DUF4127 family protein [Streptomyces sp. AJS327]|uniref:DUF4127 family protein n=1 Tax=Streptomyces sp. AJS327 TaxID=2545265 RepID=UPI0015DD69A7|nr:DUF4127 family protein [Streptomyces sp. AJS327]MBA0052511.1 DUF4127 family protein [Streptomyces sp. AJS327]